MQIGYARVSTEDQKLRLQRDALRGAGCERIFEDKASGAGPRLPMREHLLEYARPGDVVVMFKLDRLGRSLRDLIEFINSLSRRGVALRCLHEALDTTTAAGKLTFHIFGALAQFEAEQVRERTRAGLVAARARGVRLGRPRVLSEEQIEMARTLLGNRSLSVRQVATQLGVHRATLYRSLGRPRCVAS